MLAIIKRFCQIGGSFGLRLFVVFDGFKPIQPRGSKEAFIGSGPIDHPLAA
jgi:hypothetical protein